MKKINNNIDKKYILDNISQIDIFSHYLNLDANIILDCAEYGTLIPSPVRNNDTNNSVGFRFNSKGKLKMRDFGGYFWGDCFDIVAYILNKNNYSVRVNDKKDFKHILKHIAIEFDIIEGVKDTNVIELYEVAKKSKKNIVFEARSWNKHDYKQWIAKYHNLLTFEYLNEKLVYPVERYWIDPTSQPEPKYHYTVGDPCYAYYLGADSKGNINVRLYFPKRKKYNNTRPKFISNNYSFQGVINLKDKYDRIILTKSYKDALVLERLLSHLSSTGKAVLITAYPSENYIMNDDLYNWLMSKLKDPSPLHIYNFLDFDFTGRKTSRISYEKYGIPYVFLTNGEFGTVNNAAKDISDFVENHGINAALTIIKQFINYYESEYEDDKVEY